MDRPILPGDKCFRLVDTFGLPFDDLQDLLHERQIAFDWLGFCRAAAKARWPPDKLLSFLGFSGHSFQEAPVLYWAIPKAYEEECRLAV